MTTITATPTRRIVAAKFRVKRDRKYVIMVFHGFLDFKNGKLVIMNANGKTLAATTTMEHFKVV